MAAGIFMLALQAMLYPIFQEEIASYNLYDKGLKNLQQEKFEMAIIFFKKAIVKNRYNQQAWKHLGIAFNNNSQEKKAIYPIQKALEINPNDEISLKEIAILYLGRGLTSNAINAYERYLKIRPTDKNVRFQLSKTFFSEERYNEALKECNNCLNLDSLFENAIKLKSIILAKLE